MSTEAVDKKMKILIPSDEVINGYIHSLIKAYRDADCEVVAGRINFYLSNYKPDIVHIHWPEYLYDEYIVPFDKSGDVIAERIHNYKEQGAKVVLTAHNIQPHDEKKKKNRRRIYETIMESCDIIVHHGQASIDLIKKEYPQASGKRHIICPHGHYLIHYREVSNKEARDYLKLPQNAFIILNFGNFQPYKGLELLRKIFRKWNHKDKLLLVAGSYEYKENLLLKLFRKVKELFGRFLGSERLNFKKIKTKDMSYYFAAADILLLSHESGLNSGVLAMAATYKKPVVFPDIGNFSEQMIGWIGESYRCSNVESAVTALDALAGKMEKGLKFDNSKWLTNNSWEIHVSRILSAISECSVYK